MWHAASVQDWFAIGMGIVQGLTEFIPVSSTAHLRVFPELVNQPDPGVAFSAVIQLGTLAAVIAFYRRELFIEMPKGLLGKGSATDARLPWMIAVATLPIVVLGLSLKDYISTDFRALQVVASTLIIFGIVMWWADCKAAATRVFEAITYRDAMLIGLAQSLALVPGVSRSGSTIVCALLLGISRPAAAKFSFLLSIPAIGGAGIFELLEVWPELDSSQVRGLVLGTISAFISGYLAIGWLIRFLNNNRLVPFAGYRIVLGAALFIFIALGYVQA